MGHLLNHLFQRNAAHLNQKKEGVKMFKDKETFRRVQLKKEIIVKHYYLTIFIYQKFIRKDLCKKKMLEKLFNF